MLTKSVEPKRLFRRKGIIIYPVHRHDDADEVCREFIYGISPNCSDDGTDSFDIREVPGYNGPTGIIRLGEKPRRTRFDPMAFLRRAIDNGTLLKHLKNIGLGRRGNKR